MNTPRLTLVIPCYNEESVLPTTAPLFAEALRGLISKGLVADESSVLFCNDGSRDGTWDVIKTLCAKDPIFKGLSLSRNRGHQNALLAGLMEAKDWSDAALSADCDGQDDIGAIESMVRAYRDGAEIVYGVRNKRETDTWFKRVTAESFYRLMGWMGAEVIFNHADYRLASSRVLRELEKFGEVNLFLRGLFPMLGFKTAMVAYERHERVAGESHYPLLKMLGFAWDGITSLSIRPIRLISSLGVVMALLSIGMIAWCLVSYVRGQVVPGWSSHVIVSCLIGGVQLISLGVIGEYVGKVYLETKHRPRYIIGERANMIYYTGKDNEGIRQHETDMRDSGVQRRQGR